MICNPIRGKLIYIGLSGTNLAGKGVTRAYIEKKYGASSISFSDILREELTKRGKAINRENLIKIGNELRKKNGANFIAKKIVEIIESIKKEGVKEVNSIFVIDSIRNPAEVKELKKNLNKNNEKFFLIFIDAPIKIRYERSKKRKREGEERTTFEEFIKIDKTETNQRKRYESNIMRCKDLADYSIINDGSFDDLYAKIDDIVNKIRIGR